MTDKQIIIDGVDVGWCKNYNEANSKDCETLYICAKNPNCDYKQLKRAENQIVELNKMVEAKEQECEAYKMEAEEGKEINAELKAENEELEDLNTRLDNQRETYWKGYQKLKATITEIKEIADKIANYYDGDEYELMRKDAEQILQKINECEGNDETNN